MSGIQSWWRMIPAQEKTMLLISSLLWGGLFLLMIPDGFIGISGQHSIGLFDGLPLIFMKAERCLHGYQMNPILEWNFPAIRILHPLLCALPYPFIQVFTLAIPLIFRQVCLFLFIRRESVVTCLRVYQTILMFLWLVLLYAYTFDSLRLFQLELIRI